MDSSASANAQGFALSLAISRCLSTRAMNAVATAGIESEEELKALTRRQLMMVRNCGERTTAEILSVIEELRREALAPMSPIPWGFL